MSFLWEMTSGAFPFSTLVGSSCVKVDWDPACSCATTGARGPSLCCARRRQWWYGCFCWFRRISRCVGFSRCVPLIVGRPKDFECGGDVTGAVLDKVIVCFTGAVVQTVLSVWRCRCCSSSSRTLTSPWWR